ncbi:hypothetical protein LZ554_007707 [Drepanopeziza brunnea f. sp. 'monogermtubi']|nr:hypothetical protein LZ554_007707 [Drepanopeziza brunnea f. sp. 'monogermtubi']
MVLSSRSCVKSPVAVIEVNFYEGRTGQGLPRRRGRTDSHNGYISSSVNHTAVSKISSQGSPKPLPRQE